MGCWGAWGCAGARCWGAGWVLVALGQGAGEVWGCCRPRSLLRLPTFIFVTLWAVPEMRGWCHQPWFGGKDTPGPFPCALQRQGRSQPAPWPPVVAVGLPVGPGGTAQSSGRPGGTGCGVCECHSTPGRGVTMAGSHTGDGDGGGGDARSHPLTPSAAPTRQRWPSGEVGEPGESCRAGMSRAGIQVGHGDMEASPCGAHRPFPPASEDVVRSCPLCPPLLAVTQLLRPKVRLPAPPQLSTPATSTCPGPNSLRPHSRLSQRLLVLLGGSENSAFLWCSV